MSGARRGQRRHHEGMNLRRPSKAQRDREALEHLGRCMIEGLRQGFEAEDARIAARPADVSEEEWRWQGFAELAASIEANPLHQRMVAAARMTVGGCDDCDEEGRA